MYTTYNMQVQSMYPIPQASNHIYYQEFLSRLQKAIQGEYEAIVTYDTLARLAPEADRKIILSILEDEKDHFYSFRNVFLQLTGREPILKPVEQVANYRIGLENSIVDELETSEFYQGIYLMVSDPAIKELFLHAMNDETRHAIWFQYLSSVYR